MGEIDDTTVAGLTATLVRAFERGDAALAGAPHEPGAPLLPPGTPVITGEDAVRDSLRRRLDGGSDGGVPGTVRIDEYGDVAVERGRHGRRAGKKLLDRGTYLAVLHRRPDEGRRRAIDMWNSDSG